MGEEEAKLVLGGLSGVANGEETQPWHLAGPQKGEVKTNSPQGLPWTWYYFKRVPYPI